MAQKLIIDLEARTNKAEKNIETMNSEVLTLEKNVQKTEKAFEGVEKATKDTAKGVKRIGATLKAIGIGLLLAAFAQLKEVFAENQKITDAFNTTFNFLSVAFNDFFNFLDKNLSVATGFMDQLFGNETLKQVGEFAYTIGVVLITGIKNLLQGIWDLGEAVLHLFKFEFEEAAAAASSAVQNFTDIVVYNKEEVLATDQAIRGVAGSISNYAKSTFTYAQAQTQANKAAQIAVAQNRIILEQKDREAEVLRQIRDNDLLTIDERIEANTKLGEVLAEQETLMLANADALIYSAQLEYDKNKNDENRIALLDAQAEREAVIAQITGFKSEQLANENALLRENIDIQQQVAQAETDIQLARLNNATAGFQLLGKMAGKNRALQAAAIIGENATGIAKQVISTRAANALVTAKYAALPGGAIIAAAEKAVNNVSLGLGIAASVAATATALKALKTGGSASPAGIDTGGTDPLPPAFNVVGASGTNQLAETIAEQTQQPVQAYVVSNDVTTAQELDRNIITGATVG